MTTGDAGNTISTECLSYDAKKNGRHKEKPDWCTVVSGDGMEPMNTIVPLH